MPRLQRVRRRQDPHGGHPLADETHTAPQALNPTGSDFAGCVGRRGCEGRSGGEIPIDDIFWLMRVTRSPSFQYRSMPALPEAAMSSNIGLNSGSARSCSIFSLLEREFSTSISVCSVSKAPFGLTLSISPQLLHLPCSQNNTCINFHIAVRISVRGERQNYHCHCPNSEG